MPKSAAADPAIPTIAATTLSLITQGGDLEAITAATSTKACRVTETKRAPSPRGAAITKKTATMISARTIPKR